MAPRVICAVLLLLLAIGAASALDDLSADLGSKRIREAPAEQPEHGEITNVPGFDGPLPSK